MIKMAKLSDVVLSEDQQAQLDALLAAAPAAFGIKEGEPHLKRIRKKIVKAYLLKVKNELQSQEQGAVEKDFNWTASVKGTPRRIAA